jgi:branched-chain amino acid transport system substrate-binding protein
VRFSRRAPAVVVAALLATGLAGCTSDDEPADAVNQVVIGADLASGSTVDTAYARALTLRVEQLNASGVLGNTKLTLRIVDNGSDATTSLRNIAAFGDDPTVAAVITGNCSECVIGATKTIIDKRLPTIALAPADTVAAPVLERKYTFKIGPNSADSASALVSAMRLAGVKKVGVLHADDEYGRGARAAFEAETGKTTVKALAPIAVKATATDVSQAVGTLAGAKPDALLFLVGPDQAGLAATSAKAAGYKGQLYFDAASAGDLFISQKAAEATENATMIFTQTLAIDDVIATTPAKATRKQWFRDYTSRYGSYSGVASLAADAVDVIGDAVVRVGKDRVALRNEIETAQLDGLSGPIRITPDNHSGLMPQALTVLVARSGRWRLAS